MINVSHSWKLIFSAVCFFVFDPIETISVKAEDISVESDVVIHDNAIVLDNYELTLDDIRRIFEFSEELLINDRKVPDSIIITSNGGDLGGALALSNVVNIFKYRLLAKERCLSSCAMALILSNDAGIVLGTRVWFHGVSSRLASTDLDVVRRQLKELLIEKSVLQDDVIDRIVSLKEEEIRVPTIYELIEYRIIQWIFDPNDSTLMKGDIWCVENKDVCHP